MVFHFFKDAKKSQKIERSDHLPRISGILAISECLRLTNPISPAAIKFMVHLFYGNFSTLAKWRENLLARFWDRRLLDFQHSSLLIFGIIFWHDYILLFPWNNGKIIEFYDLWLDFLENSETEILEKHNLPNLLLDKTFYKLWRKSHRQVLKKAPWWFLKSRFLVLALFIIRIFIQKWSSRISK